MAGGDASRTNSQPSPERQAMTTPLDLGPIKEREARAMRGPWAWDGKVWDYDPENEAPWLVSIHTTTDEPVISGQPNCEELDADFIANARTDIPLLVAEVERLRALLDEARESLESSRAGNQRMADGLIRRDNDLCSAVDPVRSWFDGDGEVAMPSDVEIAKMAVEELQKDREEVLRLRAAMNQIIATTSEPVIKRMACTAMGVAT